MSAERQKRPQVLPTRRIRGLVQFVLQLGERIPVVRGLLNGRSVTKPSEVPLTLVMPLHPKDLWIAPVAVNYALKNIRHPVAETVIVSPEDAGIAEWAQREGLRLLPEEEILGYSKREVEERLPDRLSYKAGWIFQQLLKLGLAKFLKTEAFLVIDADTLLLRPKVFLADGVLHLGYSHERNLLYRKSYTFLLGKKCRFLRSFVCHHMFAEGKVVEALKAAIEERCGEKWDDVIIALGDSEIWTEEERKLRPFNYFSEYETYANFSLDFYPEVELAYFRNHSAKEFDPQKESIEEYVEKLPDFFHWASFHSYYGYRH